MTPLFARHAPGLLLLLGALLIGLLRSESILAKDEATPRQGSPTAGGAPILARLPACAAEPFEDPASGLTGYRDAQGKVSIPARFAVGGAFSALGVAPVVLAPRFGYIDCKGRFFETLSFDNGPDDFRDGLVRVRKKGRIGYANLAGQIVIPPRFEDADRFCRGVARVGEQCRTHQEGEHRVVACRGTRYIDTRGRFVPEPAELPDSDDCDAVDSLPAIPQ